MSDVKEKSVLICDDDELLRDFYVRTLKKKGVSVTAAGNGEVAINILKDRSDFNLAIVDLLMPVRSGWEVIEFIKSEPQFSETQIVAITGLSTSKDEIERLKPYCERIVNKNEFDLDEFNSIVDEFLGFFGILSG